MSGTVLDTDPTTRTLFEPLDQVRGLLLVVVAKRGERPCVPLALSLTAPPRAHLRLQLTRLPRRRAVTLTVADAVDYWKRHAGTMDPFSSDNIDGKKDKDGFCHESFGIFGHGSCSMNIIVTHCSSPNGSHGVNTLKKVLKSRGLSATGGKADLQMRLDSYVDKSWKRPLYEHEKEALAKQDAAAAIAVVAAAATTTTTATPAPAAAAPTAEGTATQPANEASPTELNTKKRSADGEITPDDASVKQARTVPLAV